MQIKQDIAKLIELQKIDSQLLALKREEEETLPKALSEFKEKLEYEKNKLSSLEEVLKKVLLKKKDRELDLQAKEEAVKKAQIQLYQLKTNQEYKAKLKEIESLKADVSVIEEDIIKILDEIEEKNKEIEKAKKEFQAQETKIKQEMDKLEKEINNLRIQIKGLEDKRNILASQIDKKILSRYEYLLKHRGGLALVPLINDSCGGCFMNLPPEIVNKIKQYKDLVQCEMCARLLYLKEDFEL